MIIIPRVIILFTYFSDVKLHGIKALIITSGKGQAKQLWYCDIIKIHTHKHTINKIVEPCQVKQHGGSVGGAEVLGERVTFLKRWGSMTESGTRQRACIQL